jgi:hypothetical protein
MALLSLQCDAKLWKDAPLALVTPTDTDDKKLVPIFRNFSVANSFAGNARAVLIIARKSFVAGLTYVAVSRIKLDREEAFNFTWFNPHQR